MAPQSPTSSSLYRDRTARGYDELYEPSRRRFASAYPYDPPTYAAMPRSATVTGDTHTFSPARYRHCHHEERLLLAAAHDHTHPIVSRLKRRASVLDDATDTLSPSATPLRRLPTIDALCGVSAFKKRIGGAMATTSSASRMYTQSMPSRHHDDLTGDTDFQQPVELRQQTVRYDSSDDASVNALDDEHDATTPTPTELSPATPPLPPSTKKRPRYLCDVDRRSIIRRIENGEKQAALAREFGVTRAAICHIKKNRDEIVSRYESLLASAQEMERDGRTSPDVAVVKPTKDYNNNTSKSNDAAVSRRVQMLAHRSVQLLLTTLRDVATPPRSFRAAADRLMTIVLEEALANVATVACELRTTSGHLMRGVKPAADRRLCCVSVGHNGRPLTRRYQQIEPSGVVGNVEIVMESRRGTIVPVVDCVVLPREMRTTTRTEDAVWTVLLVVCSTATGASVCAAMDALLHVGISGVAEEHVCVVALACSAVAVHTITTQFPRVRVLTCAIEDSAAAALPLATTLSDFVERYDGVKVERPDATASVSGSRALRVAATTDRARHAVVENARRCLYPPKAHGVYPTR